MAKRRDPERRAKKLCPTPPTRQMTSDEVVEAARESGALQVEIIWAPYRKISWECAETEFWWVRLPDGEIVEVPGGMTGNLCTFGGKDSFQMSLYKEALWFAKETKVGLKDIGLSWKLLRGEA